MFPPQECVRNGSNIRARGLVETRKQFLSRQAFISRLAEGWSALLGKRAHKGDDLLDLVVGELAFVAWHRAFPVGDNRVEIGV